MNRCKREKDKEKGSEGEKVGRGAESGRGESVVEGGDGRSERDNSLFP